MSKSNQRRPVKVKRRKERQAKVRFRTIATGGRVIKGLPFMGEKMVCILCGKEQVSDPKVKSDWRCVKADGVPYYACTDHFPPDDGTTEQFQKAYMAVLLKIEEIRNGANHEQPDN